MSENIPRGQTVAIATLGCKVNQYESASFQSGMTARGLELVAFSRPADIYVVNTCAVTAKAAAQSRNLIRRAARANPGARLIVTGCYAQVDAERLEAEIEAPLCIVGNGRKHELVDIVLADGFGSGMLLGEIGREKEICRLPVLRFPGRTRAFLRIQDGCNNFCSYCIVPFARGRSRSLPPAEVFAQARIFAEEGYRELVLTGIHAGAYGLDLEPALTLPDLIAGLAEETAIPRFRISSLEPTEVTSGVLRLLAGSERLMPHLHIPLQSGDDRILQRMKRHYSARAFAETVRACVAALPDMAIGIDVLAGFPGEDDEAFARTLAFIEDLPVAYLHVFPFSRRPGTVAAGLADQVPARVKAERVAQLRELDHKKRTSFYNRFAGSTRQVLLEGMEKPYRLLRGFTDNYIPVLVEGPETLCNQVVRVKIQRIMDRQVFGTVVW